MSATPKLGFTGKITCRDMVAKPVAIGERPVAANKNQGIQNSGRRHVRTAPRKRCRAAAFIHGEILTRLRVLRSTPVADHAAFQHAAGGWGRRRTSSSLPLRCRHVAER